MNKDEVEKKDSKVSGSETYIRITKILNRMDVYGRKADHDSTTLLNMKVGTERMIIDSHENHSITEAEYEELIARGAY